MNQILIRWAATILLPAFLLNTLSASSLSGDPASFIFSLDSCNAWLPTDDNNDFSEFTGTAFNTAEISMTAVGGNLYRVNPDTYGHSCTAGLNGTNAMCVSANTACIYQPESEQSVRFDIQLNPIGNKFIRLSELNFQELSPEIFSWNDGFTSVNNYPTRYALRVSRNGQVVYQQEDIQATQEWSLESFTFSGPEFTCGAPTTFNFELLAYCPIDNGAIQRVWDLEDIEIKAECLDQNITNGGEVTGGPFSYCLDTGPFFLPVIGLFFTTGQNQDWVITNAAGTIIAIPEDPQDVDFAALGGTMFLQNVSYQNGLTGLTVGSDIANLNGVFSISNSVSVTGINPSGGTIEGGPFSFCIDGEADFVSGLTISGNSGSIMQWVITDPTGLIMDLPADIEGVNFDAAGVGDCFIWNVNYETVSGLAIGQDLEDLTGCFGVSNGVLVERRSISGGTLSGGPFQFCVDGEQDFITGISLSDVDDDLTTSWVITDAQLNILGIPADPGAVDFNEAGPGVCFLWNIASLGELEGLELDNTLSQIEGCFGISNSIQITRIEPNGGELTGGPFEFCVDGVEDNVSGISLDDTNGTNQWVVTDEDGVILGLPDNIEDVNFDDAGIGSCFIYNISFTDDLQGLEIDNDLINVDGCYAISNSILVNRSTPAGGTLTGGPYNFCIDGEEDNVNDLELDENDGANSSWVITDEEGTIIGLPEDISDVNFDDADGGVCLIYNLSFQDGITGLEIDADISELDGCFALSNSISVNRTAPQGGSLSGGPFEFCLDGQADMVTGVSVTGNSGVNSSWLVTTDDNEIIAITNEIDTIDFDGAEPGFCLIWNISYGSDIVGLEEENTFNNLEGCFALSDSIVVTRIGVDGGVLDGGPFSFCLDDTEDMISDITLSGNVGANSTYIITDEEGDILELTTQPDTIDFNNAPAGVCLIWNISYEDGIDGLDPGNNVSELIGCFGISNSISVLRSTPEAGTLTSEDFDFMVDGTPDMVSGIVVSDTSATNYSWLITDADLNIIGLPDDIEAVDFDAAGIGICLIWYIGYADGLQNLEIDNNVNDLEGCFDLSNSITVNRMASAGGVIAGGPFNFCVDGNADMVSGITLTGNMGSNSQWVITNEQDSIVGLPDDIEMVDFDAAGVGVCYIYHLSHEDNTTGIALGNFLSDIDGGGFALSNNLVVNRTQPSGGTLLGGPYSFCLDNEDDFIVDLVLTGNVGSNTQWIVTDENENIITVTDSIQNVNFNDAVPGTCLIWSITYEDGLNGLINDSPLSILDGCFNLSNSIEVVRSQISGGTIEGGPFSFCIDMEMDTVTNITLAGATGQNNAWVITDEEGNIVGLPDTITTVDFNAAGLGVCLIWNISFQDGLEELEVDNNVSDLVGCFSLSNAITVTRGEAMSSIISGGPYNFTIDGIEDFVTDVTIMTIELPANEQWIVTTPDGDITVITDDIETVNFDAQGVGECLIYHIGFLDGISGLAEGNNIDDIEGCFGLSNSISVTKMASTGGSLSGGPFNFCVDGTPDFVSGLEITDNMGSITGWIITDTDGLILETPNNIEVVDFDEAGVGTCYIYHISYEPMLTGLAEGNNISDLMGTFGLSNFVEVERSTPMAGTLTGGPFEFCIEGTPDMVTGVQLTGNVGDTTSWVITDNSGLIIGLPDTLANVNFDDGGPGICLIYSVSYNEIEGLAIDSMLTDLEGCFELTESIQVTRNEISGGTLLGGPYNFCIDGQTDNVTGIDFSGSMGQNQTWLVTDENGVITHLEANLGDVDFDTTGQGTCFVYNLTYETGITGLVLGASIDALEGCFDFSDALTVNKSAPVGGTVAGESVEFCIDANEDFVTDFTVSGNVGLNFSWLIATTSGDILAVPSDITAFNFNNLNPGTCFVYHISYNDGIDGLFVGENVADLDGCFSISPNNISVTKIEPLGGSLSPINYSFCVDGMPDLLLGLSLTDTLGVNFDWVITDLTGVILDIPNEIDTVDFDNSAIGTCLVYNITYEDGLTGLTDGENISDLEGCFSFSNSVQVIKEDCVLMTNDSIVINEIFPSEDLVELKNVGDVAIDVSGYYLHQFPIFAQITNLPLDCNPSDYILDPGEVLVLVFNSSLSSQTGEMALFNSDVVMNDFDDADNIVDYVEWGGPDHDNSLVAIEAGIWGVGDFVPAFSINNSIEYDGFGNSPFDWIEDAPSLCTDNNFVDPNNPEDTEVRYSLYPNPGKEEIKLDFTKAPDTKVNARIYNTYGKLILIKEIDLEYGEDPSIDINGLNEGAYILEISAKGYSETQRFVKIN